jgi:hypothetical protein
MWQKSGAAVKSSKHNGSQKLITMKEGNLFAAALMS